MDRTSIIRFIALVAGVIAYFGFEVREEFQSALVDVVFGAYILYMGYKNNYIFKKGAKQKEILKKNNLD